MLHFIESGKYLLIFSFLVFSNSIFGQDTLQWEYYHPLDKQWISIGESGNIQNSICSIENIDPLYSQNAEKLQWIEEYTWKFRSFIEIPFSEKNTEYYLKFENIDTHGEVFLNGMSIYNANNFFHPHKVKLNSNLIEGINKVEVVITPPVLFHKKRYKKEDFHYPCPNDVSAIKVASYSRKPQFQFGWDWCPRLNTIGLNKPCLLKTDDKEIDIDVFVNTVSANENQAVLEFSIQGNSDLKIQEVYSHKFNTILFSNVDTKQNTILSKEITIPHPSLWSPYELGKPNLINDTVSIQLEEKLIEIPITFGIRQVELIQKKENLGESFLFKINGEEIYCKGANVIPAEMLNPQKNNEKLKNLIRSARANNFNMLRIWGGGDYLDEEIYKLCDSIGMMIWQDYMFACAMYPGDKNFLDQLIPEIEFQSKRISKHPSVVIFNGNNEVDVAWNNWGFQDQFKLNEEKQNIIEQAYDTVFKRSIPFILKKYSNTPYVHTSPLSNWGTDSLYNFSSQHYWGVWHGSDPLTDFSKKFGRFNTEFGFQGIPELSTLKQVISDSINLQSDDLNYHQKSYVGTKKIKKHTGNYFKHPQSFHEFVYQSQIIQLWALQWAISSQRMSAPKSMGSIYWQLNDCWPGITWSTLDYYGKPKASQYLIKELFKEIAIFPNFENSQYIVCRSNRQHTEEIQIEINQYNLKGKRILTTQNDLKSQNDWTSSHSMKIHKKADLIEFVLNKDYTFNYAIPKKTKRKVKELLDFKISFDESTHQGKITFKTLKNMKRVWFVDETQHVECNRNFQHFKAGTHSIEFKSEKEPKEVRVFYY